MEAGQNETEEKRSGSHLKATDTRLLGMRLNSGNMPGRKLDKVSSRNLPLCSQVAPSVLAETTAVMWNAITVPQCRSVQEMPKEGLGGTRNTMEVFAR